MQVSTLGRSPQANAADVVRVAVASSWRATDWRTVVGRGSTSDAGSSRPDSRGRFDDVGQLRPLLVLGQRVALDRAGEAALRAEAQPVERHVRGGLVDPGGELVVGLERRAACW